MGKSNSWMDNKTLLKNKNKIKIYWIDLMRSICTLQLQSHIGWLQCNPVTTVREPYTFLKFHWDTSLLWIILHSEDASDGQTDAEPETVYYHGQSQALTEGQGVLDHIDSTPELYDGIMCMICITLANSVNINPGKSMLIKCKVGPPWCLCGWIRPWRIWGLHHRHHKMV